MRHSPVPRSCVVRMIPYRAIRCGAVALLTVALVGCASKTRAPVEDRSALPAAVAPPGAPATPQTPVAAVDLLEKLRVQRIFNAYQFGGYLISRDVPVYVDGRAELYGEKFVMDFFKATEGKKPELLPRLLDQYKIDATLLVADAPGPQILGRL